MGAWSLILLYCQSFAMPTHLYCIMQTCFGKIVGAFHGAENCIITFDYSGFVAGFGLPWFFMYDIHIFMIHRVWLKISISRNYWDREGAFIKKDSCIQPFFFCKENWRKRKDTKSRDVIVQENKPNDKVWATQKAKEESPVLRFSKWWYQIRTIGVIGNKPVLESGWYFLPLFITKVWNERKNGSGLSFLRLKISPDSAKIWSKDASRPKEKKSDTSGTFRLLKRTLFKRFSLLQVFKGQTEKQRVNPWEQLNIKKLCQEECKQKYHVLRRTSCEAITKSNATMREYV